MRFSCSVAYRTCEQRAFQEPSDDVRTWTDADVIALIQCHDDKVAQLDWVKKEIKELARSVVDFEVNDLEPVVEKLLSFLDQLD